MSSAIFPKLKGVGWPKTETIITSTRVSKHVSGRVVTAQLFKYPLYAIELQVNGLSASAKESDFNLGARSLQAVQAFYANRAGAFDPFCLKKADYTGDPCDSRVEGGLLGIGDGANSTFTFLRFVVPNVGAQYQEPVGQVEPLGLNVYVNGALQTLNTAYKLGYPNTLVFQGGHIPAAGAQVTADYTFYWRVRFSEDTLEAINNAKYLWEIKKLLFQTDKYP